MIASIMINLDKRAFYSYDSGWERTFFDERTGGFVVTELARKYKTMSKHDLETFLKEQRMAMRFASFGFQIEHLNEMPGISSPDAYVRKHGGESLTVKGHLADFKSTKSANNIVEYAKHAVRDQGADFLLIEFLSHDVRIPSAIRSMISNKIHGYYYYWDDNKYRSF